MLQNNCAEIELVGATTPLISIKMYRGRFLTGFVSLGSKKILKCLFPEDAKQN